MAQKNISIQPLRFAEFRRLKLDYQHATDTAVLSDSEYCIKCAQIVDRALKMKQGNNNGEKTS